MRILFAGTTDIGGKVLCSLAEEHELVGVITQPDRRAGRKQELQAPAIKKIAQEFFPKVPLLQPEKLREPDVIAWLQALTPDVMVTMAYGKILPPEILTLPKIACLNIHVSLLPRHRGASPIQASILSGDNETGVTIMHMAEGLDTGDILLQKKIALTKKETTGTLTEQLALLAPEALREALFLLKNGLSQRIAQQENLATITHCILRPDAFLDWSQSAVILERLVRAMNPKPGAHSFLQLDSGEKIPLKIFSASIVEEEKILENHLNPEALQKFIASNGEHQVGSFFYSKKHGLIVRCHEGFLLLEEVQPEGGSRMSAGAFVRGYCTRKTF
ncbi:MAG: methionyl-tRNA formyltransferase [Chthoniobacterales bacterium]